MIVPIWLIVTAVAIGVILLLATILMFSAWKGMEMINRELEAKCRQLEARLSIVQVDVSGFFDRARQAVDRSVRSRGERFRLDDGGRP